MCRIPLACQFHPIPLSTGCGPPACLGLLGQLRCPAKSFQLSILPFQYKGANIQLLDLPGIIEGAAQGWLMSVFMYRRDLPSIVSLGVSDIHRFPGPRVPTLSSQIFESLILCEARFLSLSPQKGLYVAQRWFSGGGSQSKPSHFSPPCLSVKWLICFLVLRKSIEGYWRGRGGITAIH